MMNLKSIGIGFAFCASVFAGQLMANPVAQSASAAFAKHCFLPSMTTSRANRFLGSTGARVDFYDLTPFFRTNEPSPPNGRPVTPGTDRRCEVAFDGDHTDLGVQGALAGLDQQGIDTPANVPASFKKTSGTALLAARRLSAIRVAVVHVGTRPGPNGVETFINVERLTRANSQ